MGIKLTKHSDYLLALFILIVISSSAQGWVNDFIGSEGLFIVSAIMGVLFIALVIMWIIFVFSKKETSLNMKTNANGAIVVRKKFNFGEIFLYATAVIAIIFSVLFGISGSFKNDAIGTIYAILLMSALIGILATFIIRGIKGESKESTVSSSLGNTSKGSVSSVGNAGNIDIEKVKKSLKNTGNSVSAIGWLTIIFNIGLYLWNVLDKNYADFGFPAVDLTGTIIMVIAASIFVILGNRISGLLDKNIKLYLKILLVLSILILVWVFSSGGKAGLLIFVMVAYIISSLNSVNKAMKSEEFMATLKSPKYILDKKGWIIFALASVVVLIFAVMFDLSNGNTQQTYSNSNNKTSSVNTPNVQNNLTSKKTEQANNLIEQVLADSSEEMNKGLPKMIDQITQLTSTSSIGKDFVYNYRIIDAKTQFTQKDLDNLKNDAINSACTNPDTKRLLDMDAGFIFNYYGSDGSYIGKLSAHSSDCK